MPALTFNPLQFFLQQGSAFDAGLQGSQAGAQMGQALINGIAQLSESINQSAARSSANYSSSFGRVLDAFTERENNILRGKEAEARLALAEANLGYKEADMRQDDDQFNANLAAQSPVNAARIASEKAQTEKTAAEMERIRQENKVLAQYTDVDKTSRFGHEKPGDPDYDSNSAKGIGFRSYDKANHKEPASMTAKAVALTQDVRETLGAKPGALISFETADGEVGYGTFEDITADYVKGRVDLYDPQKNNPLADKKLRKVKLIKQGDDNARGNRLRALAEENQKLIPSAGSSADFLAEADIDGTIKRIGEDTTQQAAPGEPPASQQAAPVSFQAPALKLDQGDVKGVIVSKGQAIGNIKGIRSQQSQLKEQLRTLRSERDALEKLTATETIRLGPVTKQRRIRPPETQAALDQVEAKEAAVNQKLSSLAAEEDANQTVVSQAADWMKNFAQNSPVKWIDDISSVSKAWPEYGILENLHQRYYDSGKFKDFPDGSQKKAHEMRKFWSDQTGKDPSLSEYLASLSAMKLSLQALIPGVPTDKDAEMVTEQLPQPWMAPDTVKLVMANLRRQSKNLVASRLKDLRDTRSQDFAPTLNRVLEEKILTEEDVVSWKIRSTEEGKLPKTEKTAAARNLAKKRAMYEALAGAEGIPQKSLSGQYYLRRTPYLYETNQAGQVSDSARPFYTAE